MYKKMLAQTAVVAMMAVLAVSCATGGGANEVSKIQSTLDAWKAGVEAKNIDQIMGSYSDNFSHAEYGSKADMKRFIGEMVDQGNFDGAKVGFTKTKITMDEKDKTMAKAYPVDFSASFGGATLGFALKKEDGGAWRFVGMDVEQY